MKIWSGIYHHLKSLKNFNTSMTTADDSFWLIFVAITYADSAFYMWKNPNLFCEIDRLCDRTLIRLRIIS